MKEKQIKPDKIVPTDEQREKIDKWFFEDYFSSFEIKEAKKSPNPAEYLRKIAVETQRGGSGADGFGGYLTASGGTVKVWLKPDNFGSEPTAILNLREYTRKLAATFAALQPAKIKIESGDPPDVFSEDRIFNIFLSNIVPSPFEPQTRRRSRFKPEEIEDLGNSILTQGLFSPIVVRPSRRFVRTNNEVIYEIVFGERRFLASELKNLPQIKCFVRELSDTQVLELQYEENHRRQENNALDDAFLFKFLMESKGYSEEQLAARLNTTRRNVVDKLKLNDLISAAVTELEAEQLPLKHAHYLAKFPAAAQTEIVREQFAYKYHDRTEKPVSFDEFKHEVEENILRRLANAPFNIGDPRLHIKQLVCVNCPEQTGQQNYLFPDHAGGDARCLNPACFRLKTDTHLKLQREAIAARLPNDENKPVEEIAKSVPLVTEKSYAPQRSPFGREKILTGVEILPAPECEYSERSLAVGGLHKGEEVYQCRQDSCEIHHPKPPPKTFDEKEFREKIRFEVFKQAIDWFDDYKSFWQFDDLIRALIVKSLMETVNAPSQHKILQLVKGWKDVPPHFVNKTLVEKFVAGFDKKQQSQILFLLTYEAELNAFHDTRDNTIRAIAKDYTKLDYDRLAEEIRETIK